MKSSKELLSAGIIDDAWLAEIEAEHKDIINKATKAAEDAPYQVSKSLCICVRRRES